LPRSLGDRAREEGDLADAATLTERSQMHREVGRGRGSHDTLRAQVHTCGGNRSLHGVCERRNDSTIHTRVGLFVREEDSERLQLVIVTDRHRPRPRL
jgi:hypothetical protein